jgi:hypothetical protein
MFITENQNVAESILFLLSAREALSYIVEESSVDHKEELKNFLMNEASDYEIMHMLIHEEMPNEKYDFANEVRLFSDLKEQVLMNFNTIGEYLGEGAVTFINKVDTVYPEFSSAAPILEFQLAVNKDSLNEGTMDVIKGLADKEGVGVEKMVNKIKRLADKEGVAFEKMVNKVKTGFKASFKRPVTGGVADADTLRKASLGGADVDAQAGQVGAGKMAALMKTIKDKAQSAGPAVAKFAMSPAGQAVGGAALAALAIYVSVKVYKRFMSKAAKSCAGQSGGAKTMCMKKHQHGAIAAQVKDLGSAMNACAKSKTPEKCKVPIQKKISKLQVKMQKMKAKMAA